MNTHTVFLEPLDVLILRGNKLFGDAGSYGESLVPPWPSVAAGALRSHLLAEDGTDFAAFARGEVPHPQLGTPSAPGAFTVTGFHLARHHQGQIEPLMTPPADLVITEDEANHTLHVERLRPQSLASGLASSYLLPQHPVLAQSERSKPTGGVWLTAAAWQAYLRGQPIPASGLVRSSQLWKIESRIGIGLDTVRRAAADGRLFTAEAVALHNGVGFLATVCGAQVPDGVLRLGGDGRAAAVRTAKALLPEPDYAAIADAGCARLLLTTPGLFAHGWLPTGAQPKTRREDGAVRFELADVAGWIVCAAVPRCEVVSGWNLAQRQPRPAQRIAPTGSVWWLHLDPGTSADALRKFAEAGLWSSPCEDAERRAQGFNRCTFAHY
jgi:CRISPR-associated protein Cmr3